MSYVNANFLTSPAELAAQTDDPQLRVIDATVHLRPSGNRMAATSGREDFDAGHVPGAQFLDLIEAASDTTTGLGFSLPALSQLEAVFRALGVDATHRVVFYSTGHLMWATRAFWLARYAGLANISVLNGTVADYVAAGGATTTTVATYPATNYVARAHPDAFATKADVLAAINAVGACTVNALSPALHSGEGDFHYGRRGHIEGSRNVYYDELMDAGSLKPAADLKTALDAKGMLQADQVITYCGGGIAATVDALACLLVGQENVAVYDGSMSEWTKDDTAPMALGADA